MLDLYEAGAEAMTTIICGTTLCLYNVFVPAEPPERQHQCGQSEIQVEPCYRVCPTCMTFKPKP